MEGSCLLVTMAMAIYGNGQIFQEDELQRIATVTMFSAHHTLEVILIALTLVLEDERLKDVPHIIKAITKSAFSPFTVLSLWWPILVLRKSQNALKMGCFGTKNGSKMGQKRIFPKLILDHLGCTNG